MKLFKPLQVPAMVGEDSDNELLGQRMIGVCRLMGAHKLPLGSDDLGNDVGQI